MGDAKRMRSGFLWNTAGQLTYMVCQFGFTLLIVRLAGDSGSSLFNLALTYTNIFLTIAQYGMYSFQVSDVHNKYPQYCYVRSRAYTIALATAVCGVTLTFCAAALGYTALQCGCIFLYHAYRMMESATDVYNAVAHKHLRLDIVGKTYALRGVLSLAVFVLVLPRARVLLLGGQTSEEARARAAQLAVVVTVAAMFAVNLLFFLLYTLRRTKPYCQRQPVARARVMALLWECAPLAVYSALNTTTASLPKIVLDQVAGGDALGIYGPVTAPVLLSQVCATYLFTPFINVFASSYAEGDRRGFWRVVGAVQVLVAALLPAGLLVAKFIGPWGLEVFVGAGKSAYSDLLGPMVVSAVLTALVLFYSMVLTVMRYMRGLIIANVCGILTAAAGSVPGIRAWDMQGTTIAAIIALLVQAGCLLGFILTRARRHFTQPPRPAQEPDGLPSDAHERPE